MDCQCCGAHLRADEIGLSRKFFGRYIEHGRCMACLAAYFRTTPEVMRAKAERFRAEGCTLFK